VACCRGSRAELGLPALVGRQRHRVAAGTAQLVPVLGPVGQPIGAVDLVLVVQVGQALGQLQAALGVAILQEVAQRFEFFLLQQLGQQAHQAPGERILVEGRAARHPLRTQHAAVGLPQEARRQRHAGGGAHAHVLGQRDLQPFGDAVRLHQHDLLFERPQRVVAQPVEDGGAQQFHLVAVQDEEAGGDRGRHGDERGGGNPCRILLMTRRR
jgi:hypothetical protein